MKFQFTNQTGETLAGNLELPSQKPRAYALFAHCFTCSKDIVAARTISRALTRDNIAVLRFDFTGLGNSEGDFANSHFSANVQDLISACNALSDSYQTPQILIGHSLGGAAVLKAASLLPEIKAVVTIGAPSDVAHVQHLFADSLDEINEKGEAEVNLVGRKFLINKAFVDDLNESEILSGIRTFKKSLLILHSPIDDTVSVDHAGVIFAAAKHPKSFVSLDNADHLLMNKTDAEYVAKVIGAWLDRYLPEITKPAIPAGKEQVVVESRPDALYTHDIFTKNHMIVADEPAKFGGADLGMNPYELLLSSLGACTAMTMKMYAGRKNITIENIRVELKHEKIHASDCESCETSTGKVDQIEKVISVQGDMTDEQKSRLLEIAERCPVNKTLQSEIKIVSKHR